MSQKTPFYSNSAFYGDQYFRYGLARSGEFNCKQAALLEKHGKAYQALHEGRQLPESEEERRFLAVCQGQALPESEHEKVWVLFCQKIAKKSNIPSLCVIPKADDGSQDESDFIDDYSEGDEPL